MKENMSIYYDEEGDYLEIYFGKIKKGYFKEIGDKFFERIDEKTGKVVGVSIMNFKKRTEKLKELKITLPFKLEIVS